MELALPVAVKFLHQGNRELSRNMASYLSLAAIDNANLLAQHIEPIIASIIKGIDSCKKVCNLNTTTCQKDCVQSRYSVSIMLMLF